MLLNLQVIILTLCLLHAPLYASTSNSQTTKINNLLMIHRDIISGSNAGADIQKNGKTLINETFKYLSDPKNAKALASPEGRELKRQQQLLANYMAVKEHFLKCIKDKDARRELHSRILDSSLQSIKNQKLPTNPCGVFNTSQLDFSTFNNNIMKIMKQAVSKDANDILKDTILTNTARAMLNHKYKFDPNFKGSEAEIKKLAAGYSVKDKGALQNTLSDYAQKIKLSETKLSPFVIKDNLNQSIQNLANNDSPEQMIQEIQRPAGVLLLTPTMREREKPISLKDVQDILKESEAQIEKEKTDSQWEKTTEGLVKINPFATGEMLMNHPEYAGIICDAINKINITDTNKDKRDRYFRVGSAILGGVLILTGVGAVAGSYVLTGSLTAGLVSGTVAGSLFAASTWGSIAAGMGAVLYEGSSAVVSHREMLQLENAFLTNNGDGGNLDDAKIALEQFKESRTSALIGLVSAGWNGASMVKLFSMNQLSAKGFALTQMKATTKIFEVLAESKVAIKMKAVMDSMGDAALAKVDTFFYQLAKVGESSRLKMLALLKDARFTSKDMKDLMEEAILAAKNCAK